MNNTGEFTIRVYGLIFNERKEILLSDEFQLNTKMTKFPGGGLEFGEGTISCLEREFEEECKGRTVDLDLATYGGSDERSHPRTYASQLGRFV